MLLCSWYRHYLISVYEGQTVRAASHTVSSFKLRWRDTGKVVWSLPELQHVTEAAALFSVRLFSVFCSAAESEHAVMIQSNRIKMLIVWLNNTDVEIIFIA